MKIRETLLYANKAITNLLALEASAGVLDVLGQRNAGLTVHILGVVSSLIVFVVKNVAPAAGVPTVPSPVPEGMSAGAPVEPAVEPAQ